MSHPFLALEGVTQVLADGRILFSDLDECFDLRPTALVGRNGVGKSVLARLLAGRLAPARRDRGLSDRLRPGRLARAMGCVAWAARQWGGGPADAVRVAKPVPASVLLQQHADGIASIAETEHAHHHRP